VNRITQSAWEWNEARNPNAYRIIFINLDGEAALKGAQQGKHQVISPEIWGAMVAWLAWTNRANGVPLMLNQWTRNAVKPTDLFFNTTQQGVLAGLGRSDLATATQADYHIAAAKALNPILDSPVIRKFWEEGTPLPASPMPNSVNTWTSETRLKNGDSLLYWWTPKGSPSLPAGWYTFLRAGISYTLDEYTTLVTKTPFDIWNESRPDMQKFSREIREAIWTYDNPQGQA
jgi:hypothetical protein